MAKECKFHIATFVYAHQTIMQCSCTCSFADATMTITHAGMQASSCGYQAATSPAPKLWLPGSYITSIHKTQVSTHYSCKVTGKVATSA